MSAFKLAQQASFGVTYYFESTSLTQGRGQMGKFECKQENVKIATILV